MGNDRTLPFVVDSAVMLYATVAVETGIPPDALLDMDPVMFHAIVEALNQRAKRAR
jgi:hypothetical protein